MVTSFKRSHARTATLTAPNPAAGHHQPTPLLETPGYSRASLGQTLVGSLLLFPVSCCVWGSVCALQVSISQSCISAGSSMVGLMETSSKRAYAIPRLLHPEPLPLRQSTDKLYLHRKCSNTVLSQSLWGLWVLVHTRFVWAHWASLAGMGFDSKCEFAPPTVLLGFLLCAWIWGISSNSFQHCTSAAPAPTVLLGLFLCPWIWGISSQLLQRCAAAAPVPIVWDFSDTGHRAVAAWCWSGRKEIPHVQGERLLSHKIILPGDQE